MNKSHAPTDRYICAGCLKPSVLAVSTLDRNRRYCTTCTEARGKGIRRVRKGAAVPQVAPVAAVPSAPLVTVLPGYVRDTRYQLPEGERVAGGFAALGIGRYLA